jgi:hypothetical protein
MQKVFISYSRKDIDFARKLATDLEKAGFDVWWDISDLKGGDDWVRTIPSAIESSQYFIILLSPDSIASQWVEREYLHALNLRLKVIPILIRPCTVPFALANINYIDFTGPEPVASLNRLLADLNYVGEPVQSTALAKKTLLSLPPALNKYKYAIFGGLVLGLILLSVLIFRSCAPVVPISPTPTSTDSPSPAPTLTSTREATATDTSTSRPPTDMPSPTITDTPTPGVTVTPSLTKETSLRVQLCIGYYDYKEGIVNVRTGPGMKYSTAKELKFDTAEGETCPVFSAISEDAKWYMIAPRQPDTRFREFEYGWVSGFALDLEGAGPFTLPVATPMPTATRTQPPTYTPTLTSTPTFTPTLIPSPTETHTPLPTDTRVPTSTPTDLPTLEPTETPTP